MSGHSPYEFVDTTQYVRDINIRRNSYEQLCTFLMIEKGITKDQAMEFIKDHVEPKVKMPVIKILDKNEYGDRYLKETNLEEHLKNAHTTKNILVPCLTQYVHPSIKRSPIASFMVKNKQKRKKYKKLEAAAAAAGNSVEEIFNNSMQVAKKTSNNSVSGAQTVASTGLKNASAHLTLTSICRITTAIGNGHTERLLSGTRMYFDLNTAIANMSSIVSGTNEEEFDFCMKTYNLVYPNEEQTFDCIMRSLSLYTVAVGDKDFLKSFISKLNALQRAMIVYTGDFYHIRELNNEFTRRFIVDCSRRKTTGEVTDSNMVSWLYSVPEKVLMHVKQICHQWVIDQDPDLGKWPSENIEVLYHTAKELLSKLDYYSLFIRTIFTNKHLPPRVASFPSSTRRVVLGGDTDSTFYTTQDWLIWYKGNILMDDDYVDVVCTMIMIVSITLVHYLAYFSAQMGVEQDELFTNEMKNEYRFDVMILTLITKHYASIIGAKEGAISSKKKYEMKGANLISAAIPKRSLESCENILKKDIIESIQTTGRINVKDILIKIAQAESDIIKIINSADPSILRKSKVKPASSYKNAESTPSYINHLLWQEVFAAKYGKAPELPYETLSVSTETDTRAKMNAFIQSIKDKEIAVRLQAFMDKIGRDKISTWAMPRAVLTHTGIPHELRPAIDYRKIVRKACNNHYLLAQSLGVYPDNDDRLTLEWLGASIEEQLL